MSQKIKGVAKGLGIIAMFSCMFGAAGLALDITDEMQLAFQIQRFADTKIDLYALENEAGNDLITKDVFENDEENDKFQIFVTEGSTYDDYCIIGKSTSRPEGYVMNSDKSIGSTEAISCEDNKNVELIAGPEALEGTDLGFVAGSVLAFGGISGAGSLGMLGGLWARRGRHANTAMDAPKQKIQLSKSPSRVGVPRTPQSAQNHAQLQEYMENIVLEWSSYEMDPVKVLDYPMISNMGFAPTSNFHLAMLRAKNGFRDNVDVNDLRVLVTDMEHAYRVMVSEAERMKWNQFSAEEQNHLRTAQRLLNIAMNSASSPNERNMAYKKLLKEVEGIITLAPATILEIESNIFLQVESSSILGSRG